MKDVTKDPVYKHLNRKHANALVERGQIRLGVLEEFTSSTNAGRLDPGEGTGLDMMSIDEYERASGQESGDAGMGRRAHPGEGNVSSRNNFIVRVVGRPKAGTVLIWSLSFSSNRYVGEGLSRQENFAKEVVGPANCCVEITSFSSEMINGICREACARATSKPQKIEFTCRHVDYVKERVFENVADLPSTVFVKEIDDSYQEEARLVLHLVEGSTGSLILEVPELVGCGRIIDY